MQDESPTAVAPAVSETTRGIAVAARDVTRVYGEGDAAVHALRGVTVEFPHGQFAAIMGPSGSGKSTLMHILAGLDQPTSGSVQIDGTEIVGMSDNQLTLLRREKIGFIFQFFNLLPMLTTAENIDLPLNIAGSQGGQGLARPPDRRRRPARPPLAQAVGALRRPAAARRRRARPADAAGRDLRRRAHGQPRLQDERADPRPAAPGRGRVPQTIIMVTHDARSASNADRILFLSDGLIVEDRGRMSSDQILDIVKGLE